MWQAPSDPALTCKQECTEIKNTSSPFRSCTHACAGTHMQGCTNIHTQARTHHSDPAHTCTQGGIRSNRCTLARTIQILHSRTRRDAQTYTRKHAPFRSCTHVYAGMHKHTHASTHHSDPAHTCTQGGIRTNIHTQARTIQILHSRMRRDALTFTHKHAPYRSCTCAPALTCTQGCRCTNRYTQARTI